MEYRGKFMAYKAGERLNSKCTKCKDITNHIVIVVVDEYPAKVECCACKSVHKYHPPEAVRKKKESGPVRVRSDQSREQVVEKAGRAQAGTSSLSTFGTSSRKTQAVKTEDLESLWRKKMSQNFSEAKQYRMDIEISKGETVEHPTFGAGIVEEIIANDKAQFLFQEGRKILKCIAK